MTWIPQDIKKKKAGAGAASANKPNVTFVRAEDVLTFPERDSKGVRLLGNMVMKPGAKMFTIYLTPSKQVKNYNTDGDEDMETIKQKYEGWHPGDDIDINEFVQNNIGVDYYIIANNCTDGKGRLYGIPCAPMKLKAEQTSDSSGTGVKLVFEQIVGSDKVPAFYEGTLTYADPTTTDETIDFTEANGNIYQLEAFDTTASITAASFTDHEHGDMLTLIGGGGSDPATLANDAGTAAEFKLKDGTTWTALKDSTITFEVFKDGTTTYLLERSRS